MCWRLRPIIVGLVVAVVFGLVARDVLAQGMPSMPRMGGLGGMGRSGGHDQRRQQQQQQDQQLQSLPSVQTTGTVEAVGPGWIQVLSSANQLWGFRVMPTAKCQLTGKAKAEALGQGCFVRFVAPVNKRRGSVDEPLTKLLVFTPSQFRQVGADPDLGFGGNFGERPGAEKTAKKAEEGARPAFGAAAGAGADAGRGAGRKSGGAAGGKGGPAAETFDVRGQVTGISGGKLWLYVPNDYFRAKIRLEIAEDADIDVEIDDPMAYTLARKGDKIRVSGRQGLGNQGFATDLEITLGEPLGAAPPETKKPPGKGDRSGRAKRGAEAEEPPAAAEKKGEKKDADPAAAARKDKAKDKDADAAEAPKGKAKDADPVGAKKAKKSDARKTPSPAKKPAKDSDGESAEEEEK